MEPRHTKEPWEAGGISVADFEEMKQAMASDFQAACESHAGSIGDYVMVIYRQDGARIAYLAGPTAEENCDRILACVNACAGVDTETLIAIANGEMNGSEIWELAKVKQQRDDLDRRATEYALQCNHYAALNAELLAALEHIADIAHSGELHGMDESTAPFRIRQLSLEWWKAAAKARWCNYPDCKCSFDMGPDNKCLLGCAVKTSGQQL